LGEKKLVLLLQKNVLEQQKIDVSEIAIEDTPHRTCLKRSIRQLSIEIVIKNKKLKSLQQTIRRKNKKIANMQTIINDNKNQNFVDEETSFSLLESFGKHKDLVTNWAKSFGKKIRNAHLVKRKYSWIMKIMKLILNMFNVYVTYRGRKDII